ncbi:MAG: O-antigen ligase [Dehalococcoidales bacterium]|nr:O-antigen ligase [Dehalococcoidales bacterium]
MYIFAVSFAILFVIKPAWDLTQPGGVPQFAGKSPDATYAAAIGIASIGAAGFYLAYYWYRPPSKVVTRARPDRVVTESRLSAYIVGVLLLAAALWGVLVASFGGLNPVTAHASGYLYSAPLLLAPAGLLLVLAAPVWRSRKAAVGFFLIALSQVPAFIGGARSWTLPVMAALVLVYYLKRQTRPSLVWIAVVAMPVFLLFVSAPRDYRGESAGQGSLIESVWTTVTNPGGEVDRFLRFGDTSMAADLAIELQYVPRELNYQYGATYAEALMRPVPRTWWPAKPTAADTQLMAVIWPGFLAQGIGFSFSAFGEPYLNFGIPGVAVFGLAAGAACGALYSWLARNPGSQVAQAVFAVSWPFVFVYMRGGIGVDYQRQLIILVPLLVGYAFAWRKIPGDHAQLDARIAKSQPASTSGDTAPAGLRLGHRWAPADEQCAEPRAVGPAGMSVRHE